MEFNCENKCPKCNSSDILYVDENVNNSSLTIQYRCSDCSSDFQEIYKISYVKTFLITNLKASCLTPEDLYETK